MDLAPDYQRKKVYLWQREFLKDKEEIEMSIINVSDLVSLIAHENRIIRPTVYHHTDINFAGVDNVLEFCYPSQFTVIHEMAHIFVFQCRHEMMNYAEAKRISAHGPQFVEVYVKMLMAYEPQLKNTDLFGLATEHKVKYTTDFIERFRP